MVSLINTYCHCVYLDLFILFCVSCLSYFLFEFFYLFMLEDKAFFHFYFYSILESIAYMSIFLMVIFKFSAPTVTYSFATKVIQQLQPLTMQNKDLRVFHKPFNPHSHYPCYCGRLNSSFQYKQNLCSLLGTRYSFLYPPFSEQGISPSSSFIQ